MSIMTTCIECNEPIADGFEMHISDACLQKLHEQLAEAVKQRDALKAACEATLLFYRNGSWDGNKQAQWKDLTGEEEATTKSLCDAVRNALALCDEKESKDG